MGDGIFFLGRDLSHGAVEALGNEEGVVAEAAGTQGIEGNLPLAGTDEGGKFLPPAGHRDGAHIAGGEGSGAFGFGSKLCQHFAVVGFIVPVGAGIAGGVDTGHATQGIDADAAVVRHDQAREDGRNALGLDGGIGREGGAGFLGVGCAGEVSQGAELKLRGQDTGEFACFVSVARSDEEGDAGGHDEILDFGFLILDFLFTLHARELIGFLQGVNAWKQANLSGEKRG